MRIIGVDQAVLGVEDIDAARRFYNDFGLTQAENGASGATFVLTNGARSLTFTIGALAIMDNSPTVGGNGEILLQLTGTAKSTGSTKELAITNDSTP